MRMTKEMMTALEQAARIGNYDPYHKGYVNHNRSQHAKPSPDKDRIQSQWKYKKAAPCNKTWKSYAE